MIGADAPIVDATFLPGEHRQTPRLPSPPRRSCGFEVQCCQAFIITLPPGRVERSEGRVEHRNQRGTLPGPKRSDPPKGE
jgi:hypothetical protein